MSAAAPTVEELRAEKKQFVEGAAKTFFGRGAAPVELEPEPEAATPIDPGAPPPAPAQPATPPVSPVPPAPGTPPTPPAVPPATPPPAPEPPKPSLAEPPAPLDAREVEGIVERALEKHTPPPVAPAAPTVKYSPKDQYTITVLRKMEVMNPVYVGIADKTIQFWKDEEAFIAEFQKTNPDKKYDDAEEYEAWLEKNEPQYDEFDFKQAENALIREDVAREADAKIKEVDRKQQAKQKMIEDQPVIQQLAYQAVTQCVVSALADKDGKLPEPLAAILMKDGKVVIDQQASEKLAEEDPVAFQVLLEESEKLNVCIQAMETLARNPDAPRRRIELKYSKGTIVPTDLVAEEADRFESIMLKRPKAETTVEGRTLISQEEFFKATEKMTRARAQEFASKYYCLGVDEFRAGLTTIFAERARERIDSMNEVVNRKMKKVATPAVVPPPATPEPTPQPAQPENNKPHSPATVSRSDIPDPSKPVVTPQAEDLQKINKVFFGR